MTTHTSLLFTTALIIGSMVIATSNASNIGQPIEEYFDYSGPLLGEETCSLISVVMDESGSMAIEQDFMQNTALPSLIQQLKAEGVDNVFVCIHGFGSHAHDPFGLDRGHFHGCTEGDSQGIVVDSSVMDSWVTEGKYEDGWQAIHNAIRDLPSEINSKSLSQTCKTLGRNMILVTDEGRHDNSCDGHLFQMEFKTDEYGAETSWILQDSQSEIMIQGGDYQPNEVVRVTECLHTNDHFKLLFADSESDGFCCDDGDGYIKVWFDGVLIADSPAEFQSYACVYMPPEGWEEQEEPSLNIFDRNGQQLETTNYYTLENTQQKLLDAGYRLTTITILSMYGLGLDTLPLGVSPDGMIVEPDGSGSYTENHGYATQPPMDLLDPNKMALDYASIAFETGGGAWLLHSLREGGQSAMSFGQAFVDFNVQDFVEDAFRTYAPSTSPSTSPTTTQSPSLSPSLAPSTPIPSSRPSERPSFRPPTAQPSEQPTEEPTATPTKDRTEAIPEGVFDGRIQPHETEKDASRTIVGFATIGLLCAVGVAFLASRKKEESKGEEEDDQEKDDHSISMRQRAGDTETESLDDTEEASSPLDMSMSSDDNGDDDSRFSLSGLAQCMEFASSSFKWDKDQDHMVDLSELAGGYSGGGFQGAYDGRASFSSYEYDEGEYE